MIERGPYEFTQATKKQARRLSKNRCELTGSTKDLECHHLLPIWMLCYIDDPDPEIIRSIHNTKVLRKDKHAQLHGEMYYWEDWLKVLYAKGMYSYLEEEYYRGQFKQCIPNHVKV